MVRTYVNLTRIRTNVEAIRARVGVKVIGVVKADAYGIGAVAVADAISDLVSGFYVFHSDEALDARLAEVSGKSTLCTVPGENDDVAFYLEHNIRPAVWTVERAARLARAKPVLSVDTGMQRFACATDQLDAVIQAGQITEAFTHAAKPEQATQLKDLLGGRGLRLHAAASALIDVPGCQLDAVRPGLMMFDGAVRVTTPLIDARPTKGPLGYGGLTNPTGHHGVILVGYSHGLRNGPVLINGRRQQILEVGMQSAYVSLDPKDRIGNEVCLLGNELTPQTIGKAWNSTPHEALHRLASLGEKTYAT
ncbi:MAG: alanine racemase [Tepidisphaeraceae bacterium]